MTIFAKPGLRPANPNFSSGPCAKRPGWSPAVLDAARDSLGGAIAVAASLPEALGAALVTAAQIAFVDALHVVAAVSAVLAAVAAVAVAYALRSVPKREDAPEA